VQNIKNQLDALLYADGQDWNKHETSFMKLIGELATYDEEFSGKEKLSKLLRSLPESFATLAMVTHLSEAWSRPK